MGEKIEAEIIFFQRKRNVARGNKKKKKSSLLFNPDVNETERKTNTKNKRISLIFLKATLAYG